MSMLKSIYGIRLILKLNLYFSVNGGTVMCYTLLRVSLTLCAIQTFVASIYICTILTVMALVKLFIKSETHAIFYSYSSSKVSLHYS